jgi:acyl-coenzyme A thioesterase PaaI-like protein
MLYQLLRKTAWLSAEKRLELYPPFRSMGIRVISLQSNWSEARILLPLNRHNRNPGGGMFGGAMASLADPIPALMCARLFHGHSVWTRSMYIDFQQEGRTDLQLRIKISDIQQQDITQQLQAKQRATPEFEYSFYNSDNQICAHVVNKVAIRPSGYRPSEGAMGRSRKKI